MSQKRLMEEMDAEDLWDWIAYEITLDPDTKTRMLEEIDNENLSDAEKEAKAIKDMFMRIAG